jgi:hypothetical protein
MARWMRDRWSVLAFVVLAASVAPAGDVTVQQGTLTATGLYVDGNATVEETAYIDYLDVYYYAQVHGDLDVDYAIECDSIGNTSTPRGYFEPVLATDLLRVFGDTYGYGDGQFDYVIACDGMLSCGWLCAASDAFFEGKIYVSGGIDPPYVLYDAQTRTDIVERVKREVPPEKQSGSVVFFNGETKGLESYTPGEGKFCDLHGNVLHTIPPAGSGPYETVYFLDGLTGQVKPRQRTVHNRYTLKRGYKLDEKSGRFTNTETGAVVPREEAVALYVAKEGKQYDLQGNPIDPAQSRKTEGNYETVTEYHFDALTGEVTTRERRVYDRFVIKKGYGFDKRTGQFVRKDTGEVVPKETAVELIRASSAQR